MYRTGSSEDAFLLFRGNRLLLCYVMNNMSFKRLMWEWFLLLFSWFAVQEKWSSLYKAAAYFGTKSAQHIKERINHLAWPLLFKKTSCNYCSFQNAGGARKYAFRSKVKIIKLSFNREQNQNGFLLKYQLSFYSILGVQEGCINTCTNKELLWTLILFHSCHV